MIRWFKDEYAVTLLALDGAGVDGVESIRVPNFGQGFAFTVLRKCTALLGILFVRLGLRGLAEGLSTSVHAPIAKHIASTELNKLGERTFDLVVSHDLVLLPLAFAMFENPKVLLDAREFYPSHYEDRPLWRLVSQPEMDFLCEMYLRRCAGIITVSEGIAREYERRYGVNAHVVMSLPEFHDLSPSPVREGSIRIIHHGIVSQSRRLEKMIAIMDFVDDRFSLDLMLVPQKSRYWSKLIETAGSRRNVRMIPPVSMSEIIHFTNSYDIGLFLCPPTTFNLKFAMPNKLFEFIQARLAVAIGPSVEMQKIVEKYQCGVVSNDFEPRSMAQTLNRLTSQRIAYYKEQSNKASKELNAHANAERTRIMVQELIGS